MQTSKNAENNDLISPHGGYRRLVSYQMAEIVYDATVKFCRRFIDRRSRTHDQMIQAARSGKQNIAEGSMASGTSKKIELKLISIVRASLEELLQDYEDYLRQNDLSLWGKGDPRAIQIRRIGRKGDRTYMSYKTYIEKSPVETAVNAVVCILHQTNYLLDQQLRQLEKDFLEKGGFTERMYRTRRKKRYDNKGY